MAALGIWLWSDLLSFGTGERKASEYEAANACAVGKAVVAIVGQDVPFTSTALRIFSLGMYTLFLIPGINLILPMILFLGAYIGHRKLSRSGEPPRAEQNNDNHHNGHSDDGVGRIPSQRSIRAISRRFRQRLVTLFRKLRFVVPFQRLQAPINPARRWDLLPAFLGLGILLTINLVFIIDIELTLRRNRALQKSDQDEADWGFGQILAVLLLLLPMRDLAEAILARKLKLRQGELDEDLQKAIEKQDFEALKRAIERGSAFPTPNSQDNHFKFWTLVSTHGSLQYFDTLRRARMTIAEKALEGDLHVAIQAKDVDAITAAQSQGADLLAGVLYSPEAAGLILRRALWAEYAEALKFHARRPGPHIEGFRQDVETALIAAVKEGRQPRLKFLLANSDVDINLADTSHQTPLMLALKRGDVAIVKTLLEQSGLQLNTTDKDGWTPLMFASLNGQETITKVLLDRPDIQANAVNKKGATALILASKNGHGGIVKMFLDGPDVEPNAVDENGDTALMHVSRAGHEGIAKMLLSRPDIQPNAVDKKGKTALILALLNGHEGIAKVLLDRPDVEPNGVDEKGSTALMLALLKGYEGITKILLDRSGVQPTLIHASSKGEVATATVLLGRPEIDPNAADKDERTPLILATLNGYEGITKVLLDRPDIQPNAADKDGWTALLAASRNGHEGIAKTLLDRPDIQPNAADKDGDTALIIASRNGREGIAKMLLNRPDIRTNATNNWGDTALMAASRNGHEGIAKMLLDRPDIQPNAANKYGWTPLILASFNGHEGIAKMLLDRPDIQPDATNNWGQTALSIASLYGHAAIEKTLRSR